jgi:hypothetical protein
VVVVISIEIMVLTSTASDGALVIRVALVMLVAKEAAFERVVPIGEGIVSVVEAAPGVFSTCTYGATYAGLVFC